ncbi:carboxypeptidase-like regulatory domain-containing protein [Nakamurella lactea]|uniref:carboxypeptidase-like regulatory domain-containing protein n=1 Tax=Nakamurella lactea TaxID=459515 RepID=UPI000491FBD3|nr:carboxypeptidase-like regulatory domain-containing protein [Nakamurella lactea]
MRVQVDPERVELVAGIPFEISVTVTNTADIIGGYHLRVLGADPGWVTLEAENLSLFPDTSQTVTARIEIPNGIGAGDRRIAVQVRELTPPQAIAVAEIELAVPAQEALRLSLSPMTVICGHTGHFGLVAENTGNTTIATSVVGLDPEDKIQFEVIPPVLHLAPGEHAIADLRASARRRWLGTPVVRPFGVAAAPARPGRPSSAPDGTPVAVPVEPLANGTMMQKPRIGRGVLSMLSLLVAVSVFATVITIALSRLVGVSAADRDLALQVAAAADNVGSGAGSSEIGGTITLLTGAPAAGVAVEVFSAASLTQPVASTATADDGSFTVASLPAGAYKVRFRGAGLAEVWYPGALTGAEAKEIDVQTGEKSPDLSVSLGGLPATVSGEVLGDDVAGAVVSIQVPADRLPAVAGSKAAAPGALVDSIPVASDGRFSLSDIASPAVYELVVTKAGFAPETQRIDLAGGETRSDLQLRLRTGDGLITGSVIGPDGPVVKALVTATTGSTTVQTLTLTQGKKGTFTVRGLVTPATYTVTVTAPGFGTQTSTLTLAAGQKLTDVRFTLSHSAGTLSGHVNTLADQAPAGGVGVTLTSGDTTVTTVTQSTGDVGAWMVAGLPLPGTYTVTFSRDDLQSQTVSVALDRNGNPSTGAGGITVGMTSAFAVVSGTVSQRNAAGGSSPGGEAVITLSSGTDTYTVSSASVPAAGAGKYLIAGVKPGTYTLSASRRGTSPTTVTITLIAGQSLTYDPVLVPGAGISGRITDRTGGSVAGLQVDLFESSQYPAQVYRSTVTDAKGDYVFENVDAPQAYVVQVRSATAGALGSATLVLPASKAGVLNLTVESTTSVGDGNVSPTTAIPPPAATGTAGSTGGTP